MYCPIESCKSQLKYEPEKWNNYQIKIKGSHIKVTLNDVLIIDEDLNKHKTIIKRHNGKDAPALSDRPKSGRIGFQNLSRGGSPVLIKNAKIKILE